MAENPTTGTMTIPSDTVDTYTEQLLYADGAVPRYTGCPTGRINILGGRYDYAFDAHDRLTRADYTAAAAADPEEDFSARYTYDALARPKTVRRMGIIDLAADGTETFGSLDRLSYVYDAAGRVQSIGNDGDPDEYYGRPGFAAGGSEYGWDAAGRMTSDTGRGLSLIKYDHRNLPLQQRFQTGLTQTNEYDASGSLVRTTMASTAMRPTMRPNVRNYAADRVWEAGKLKYSYFPGGYFDGSGRVHYLHNDYQGSVVMVTDSAGTVEQRNTYYPYGEPHRTPSGQPRLYVGKERMAETDEYDYGARRHHPSGIQDQRMVQVRMINLLTITVFLWDIR